MHERNPYSVPPDFGVLADDYTPLRPHVFCTDSGTLGIDFRDPIAQRRLTEALLHRDFHLSLNLPEGRLCPPVPNRLNYILWLQDLLTASSDPTSESVIGIDIGTGASAIYPLLACRLEPGWKFVATEIDEISRQSALLNAHLNGLDDRIEILPTSESDPLLLPFVKYPQISFAFTMCNPPFYSSANEVEKSAEAKIYGPSAVCTGAEIEMITPGGELTFVRRMVEESILFRTRCRWYTSMLGKLSSVAEIVEELRSNNIDNYGITELIQGQTRRWAIAWSFGCDRLPDSLTRPTSNSLQSCLPMPTTLRQPFPGAQSGKQLLDVLATVLDPLGGVKVERKALPCSKQMHYSWSGSPAALTSLRVFAAQNTWSRAARRKNLQKQQEQAGFSNTENKATASSSDSEDALEVIIHESINSDRRPWTGDNADACSLDCDWVRGRDRALFESFWSHVSRKVGVVLGAKLIK